MTYDVGTARGFVDIDVSGLTRNLNRGGQQFNNFINRTSQRMSNMGNNMASVGSRGMLMMTPLIALGGIGLKAAGDFDSAMTEISARTGLAGDAMEEVRAKAMELGRDTQFSATQSANAFLQLTTAGLSTEQALVAVDHALNGAAAGGVEIARAADLATNIMSSFQLEASDLEGVMDSIIQGAASSPASFDEMGEAMQAIGADASNLGISYEETAGMLAILAQQGIRGAEAGTQLKSMFTGMQRQSERTQNTWSELGISMFDTEGNARSMNDVFADLSVAMEGMSDEQRNIVTQNLAGTYGRRTFNALLNAGEGIDGMVLSMQEQATATEVAEERSASFQQRLISLKGSVESLMINAFTPLMNLLLPLINDGLIPMVNRMSEWIANNEVLATQVFKMLGGFMALFPVLFIVGKAIALLGFLFGVVFNPITWIIGLIGLLTYQFRDQLTPVINQFKTFFMALVNSFQLGMSPIASIQRALNIAFGPGAGLMFMNFVTQFQTMLTNIRLWIVTVALPVILQFIGYLQRVWTAVAPYLTQLWTWFTATALPFIMGFITNTVVPIIAGFINNLIGIWTLVSPYLFMLFAWFVTYGLPIIWGVFQGFINLLTGAWVLVSVGITALKDGMDTAFTYIKDHVLQPVTDAISTLFDWFGQATTAAGNFASAIGLDAVGDTISQLSQLGGMINSGEISFGDVTGAFGDAIFGGSRDSGGPGQAGMAYAIGAGAQPEMFIPNTDGQFIPNADQLGRTINLNGVTIVANDPEDFVRRLDGLIASDGDY